MVVSCSAINCTKRLITKSGTSFHRFPHSDPNRLRKWTLAVHRKGWSPTKSSYLCSDHFVPSDYYADQRGRRCLKKEAVPSVFEFTKHLMPQTVISEANKYFPGFPNEIVDAFETAPPQGMFTSTGCTVTSGVTTSTTNIFDQSSVQALGCEAASVCPEDSLTGGVQPEQVMKQPLIAKQFSLCPDTGELEASRRSQEKQLQQRQQQQQEHADSVGLGLPEGHSFVGTDLVDPKLLASLSFDSLDLKLEDPSTHELLVEHVVKTEGGGGGDHYADAVALAALGGAAGGNGTNVDMDDTPVHTVVKREPSNNGLEDEIGPAKVRRIMVNDATIQQLLTAAGQVGGDRSVSLAVDPRLQQVVQYSQPQPQQPQPQQQQSQQQTKFLIAWKAENNELVPVCIPVQTGAGGGGQKVQLSDGSTIQLPPGTDLSTLTGQNQVTGVSSPQHQQQLQMSQPAQPQPQQQVQQILPVSGTTQGTIIQLPANNIIPALAQGATIQIPAGSAFPGLTQALQIPSSGILQAAGSQGTVLQLPSGLNSSDGTAIVQIPAGHFQQQQIQQHHLQQVMVGQGNDGTEDLGQESIVIKQDHDMNVGDVDEEVIVEEKCLNLAGQATDDVTSSSVTEAGPSSSAASRADGEEPELETTEEEQDSESWRLRHAVTILEKSQINFLRDARRSFKCYQCGGLIRPPALEVEVDLAPYGIRPVLCTDCGKFHLNKRNVNVRVTTDEGCEQLHRFMSA